MREYLEHKQEEMLLLLERLVNIDSGSANKQGLDEIARILQAEYEQLGFNVHVQQQQQNGNHLLIQHKEATEPEIIIVAHMDTVFPDGTAAERPFTIKGDRAYGPGVIDMKASQVALLYALKALIVRGQSGYKNVFILLNSDEEIGSHTSRLLIEEKAKGKRYAFIMEPARKDGSIVSSRLGGGNYVLSVQGKAAHSGIEPQNGCNAIDELAHKIIKLRALNNYDEGMIVNVGFIEGGQATNIVAPTAAAHIGIRMRSIEQAEYLDTKIREICATPDIPGTTIQVEGGLNRPPMFKDERTIKLVEIVKRIGAQLGITITDTSTGGGSDASFTSQAGVATIDGLGPVGGNAHSDDEYLEIPSLVERTHLLAELIEYVS